MQFGPQEGHDAPSRAAGIIPPARESAPPLSDSACLDDHSAARHFDGDALALAQARRMLQFVGVSRALFPDLRDLADHPGWEIMLQLFIAPREGRTISTDELCALTGCWRPLANRYIDLLFERGIIARDMTSDKPDRWPLRLTGDAEARFKELLCGFARGWPQEAAPDAG
jgi:hypothetical protein